jgi:hypothetical protein
MSLLNRLKQNVLLIGFFFSWAFLPLMEPIEAHEGSLLILYGVWLAWLDRSFNPQAAEHEAGPFLRWDEMHAGDRLAYFFPAMSITVVGVLIIGIMGLSIAEGQGGWTALGFGGLFVALGGFVGWQAWTRRWDAARTD